MSADRSVFLERLYKENSKKMYNYALSVLEDEYLAEDAVQEVFSIAWTRIERMIVSPNHGGWLINTLKNVMMRIVTERAEIERRLLPMDGLFEDAQHVSNELNLSILFEGIISEEEFRILVKLYVYGYKYKELAAELGVPLSTVAMKIKRAKEKFQKKYDFF